MDTSFDALLEANRRYATSAPRNFDGYAHAGVAIVTCMDSRLQPLEMVGLYLGEAKILRTPGGHVTPDALAGCALGVQLLRVTHILVVAHTRCAMASGTDDDLRRRIAEATGADASEFAFGADPDQAGKLRADVDLLRAHPLIAGRAQVGGFLYDVDTGILERLC
ncbi:MAG: carbonic anhydrase [Propioniciclava sp.]|uniref:beta-class carbonic anhydrase n=1 Tax=Propioniciclava sp. TaxID=2038686 RepID=UPI0039E3876D